ncbi:MAG TPA: hypothetical protein VER79_00690 [Candidatus Limnocylindrales bacterium]|nr:hypothetical protein [Candidatus Limnocylindrales bacterium]
MAYAQNPYFPGNGDERDLAHAPFAGRQAAFARLYQTLNDPAGGRALLVTGRARIGRTSLLYAFDTAFGDTIVSALVPLRLAPLGSEMDFVLEMAQDVTAGLIKHDVPIGKLNDLKPPAGDARIWFEDEFLPAVFHQLRLRRLALLIDDADRLLSAMLAEDLPDDLFVYLHKLLERWPALGVILSAPDDDTLDAASFGPLVTLNDHVRLMNLAPDETRWLIQEPVRAWYSAPSEAAAAVQRSTGGAPALVQQFGYHLFSRWEAGNAGVLGLDDVRAVTPMVYQGAQDDFRRQWSSYTLNERLVLTAITDLIYDDPLDKISVPVLQTWLTDTDYPLDTTAILSALRSLEYNEIVAGMPDAIVINSGMLQTWLLENARLQGKAMRGEPLRMPASAAASAAAAALRGLPADSPRTPSPRSLPSLKGMPRRAALLLAGLLLAAGVLGASMAMALFGGAPSSTATVTPPPAPTVTLVTGP